MIQKSVFFLVFIPSLAFGQMMGSDRVGMMFSLPVQDLTFQGSAWTSAMRVNPFPDLTDWYTGPRELEVPRLEWELNRGNSPIMTFEEAQAYAASRAAEGWRLPTIWELEALYRQQEVLGGDMGDIDEDSLAGAFWSATEVHDHSDYTWYVNFVLDPNHEERVDNCFHELELRVRLVRDAR
ncbi:MAG: DUF1566 domain-containing protein [Myxococcaceae bacterium]|nr:DUF1566 domain-containing protein [Myxococcaceae bacterium]MBH2006654.1 DUF1566 domain-containing protein [Myxococcaceae bacterium]